MKKVSGKGKRDEKVGVGRERERRSGEKGVRGTRKEGKRNEKGDGEKQERRERGVV